MTTNFAPSQQGYTIPDFTLGDRLRKARELTGLSQGDFATEIGVSKGTVVNYENDATPAKRPALMMWSMRTRVPVEWLTEGQTDPEPPPSAESDARSFSDWRSRTRVIAAAVRPVQRLHSVAA